MTEAKYQTHVLGRIAEMLPGSTALKNDSAYQQGIPDWTIFYGPKWAMLEIKASRAARRQPNQEYYIEKFNGEAFAAFIYPENEQEVLDALQEALAS
ncbi:MAG TPA: hypothetical protein PKD12_08050 [Nitrospira sp.]|nr:hypothetical protein [Nitrospira sp.]